MPPYDDATVDRSARTVVLVALFARVRGGWVRLPYYAIGPGPRAKRRAADRRAGRAPVPLRGPLRHDDRRVQQVTGFGSRSWRGSTSRDRGLNEQSIPGRSRAGAPAGDLSDGPEQDRRVDRGARGAHRLPAGARRGRPDPGDGPDARPTASCSRATSCSDRRRASTRPRGRVAGDRPIPAGRADGLRPRCRRRGRPETEFAAARRADGEEPLVGIRWSTRSRSTIEIVERRHRRSLGRPDVGAGAVRRSDPGDLTAGGSSPARGRSLRTATSARSAGSPTRWWRPRSRAPRSSSCPPRTWTSSPASTPATCGSSPVATFDDAVARSRAGRRDRVAYPLARARRGALTTCRRGTISAWRPSAHRRWPLVRHRRGGRARRAVHGAVGLLRSTSCGTARSGSERLLDRARTKVAPRARVRAGLRGPAVREPR